MLRVWQSTTMLHWRTKSIAFLFIPLFEITTWSDVNELLTDKSPSAQTDVSAVVIIQEIT